MAIQDCKHTAEIKTEDFWKLMRENKQLIDKLHHKNIQIEDLKEMTMRLTKKQKKFLYDLLKPAYALSALSSAMENQDSKAFKEDYGITIKKGFKYYHEILNELERDLNKPLPTIKDRS